MAVGGGGESPQIRLTRLGLTGDVTVEYQDAGQPRNYHARMATVDVGLGGMFISWSRPPAVQVLNSAPLKIRWIDPPFSDGPFEAKAEAVARVDDGIHVSFAHLPSEQAQHLYEWVRALESRLEGVAGNEFAIQTSRWYTISTVTSAAGLCLGAVGMFFQLMRWFTSFYVPQILLLLMVISIAAFAYMRALAGRYEVQAIRQGIDSKSR